MRWQCLETRLLKSPTGFQVLGVCHLYFGGVWSTCARKCVCVCVWRINIIIVDLLIETKWDSSVLLSIPDRPSLTLSVSRCLPVSRALYLKHSHYRYNKAIVKPTTFIMTVLRTTALFVLCRPTRSAGVTVHHRVSKPS